MKGNDRQEERADVVIPTSALGALIGEANGIKRRMEQYLLELEHGVVSAEIERPGGWRQDPLGWYKRHR